MPLIISNNDKLHIWQQFIRTWTAEWPSLTKRCSLKLSSWLSVLLPSPSSTASISWDMAFSSKCKTKIKLRDMYLIASDFAPNFLNFSPTFSGGNGGGRGREERVWLGHKCVTLLIIVRNLLNSHTLLTICILPFRIESNRLYVETQFPPEHKNKGYWNRSSGLSSLPCHEILSWLINAGVNTSSMSFLHTLLSNINPCPL